MLTVLFPETGQTIEHKKELLDYFNCSIEDLKKTIFECGGIVIAPEEHKTILHTKKRLRHGVAKFENGIDF